MTRQRAIFNDKNELVGWISTDELREIRRKKSAQVVEDTCDPFVSHVDSEGRVYDSMSAYKRDLDEKGYEVTGGDHNTGKTVENHRYKSDRNEINASVQEAQRRVRYDMEPFSKLEKQRCLEHQRAIQNKR